MTKNLSVSGVTNATYVANGTNTTKRTTMIDLAEWGKSIEIFKRKQYQQYQEVEKEYAEAVKKQNEQILKEILK